MTALGSCSWPLDRLGEAVDVLARAGGVRPAQQLPVPASLRHGGAATTDATMVHRWLEGAADCLGLQLRRREVVHRDLATAPDRLAPALLQVAPPPSGNPRLLVLLEARRRRLRFAAPNGSSVWLARSELSTALGSSASASLHQHALSTLEAAGLSPKVRPRAAAAIVERQLGPTLVAQAWQFRLPITASFWRHATAARIPQRVGMFLAMHTAQVALMVLSWWVLGKAALQGHVETGWLFAWLLLALTQVPLGMTALRARGTFAISLGGLLKSRLLEAAFANDPDATRQQGAGQLLGRVIESDAVERLALTGGLAGAVALIELSLAMAVLALGPGGTVRVAIFGAWLALSVWSGWRFYRARLQWTSTRRMLTNDLVERMVGHRTRLAQQLTEQLHDGEDAQLTEYIERSEQLDARAVFLGAVLSRGWLAVGLCSLLPVVVVAPENPIAIAVALGGVLLAARALGTLGSGMDALGGAAVAWQQVRPLLARSPNDSPIASTEALLWMDREAQPSTADVPPPEMSVGSAHHPHYLQPDRHGTSASKTAPTSSPAMLQARNVVFRYRLDREPVLNGCDLQLAAGDRLLIEGPSGGGKSTLAMIVAGLRHPEHGMVLFDGLDPRTLGERIWRRRVAAAPQYHENHIFTGTLAFNLLMGRRWPASNEDLAEAERVCRELGLGDVIDRMPAGLRQVVGDTGWRLSHGERGRVYIARCLLQRAEVVLFDESFAALDPASMAQSLRCVMRRAPTLVVIAHP